MSYGGYQLLIDR